MYFSVFNFTLISDLGSRQHQPVLAAQGRLGGVAEAVEGPTEGAELDSGVQELREKQG